MMFWRSNNDQSKKMNNFYSKGLKIDFCSVPLPEDDKKTSVDLGICGATKWELVVERKDEKVSIMLNCEPSESCLSTHNNWAVHADVSVRLQNQKSGEKALAGSGFDIPFDRKEGGHNWKHTFDKVNEKNGLVKNGEVMFQINVGISKIEELYSGDFIDFSVPREGDSDVILVVGEKKFHVSKQILSINSQVFQAMFYGNFKESEMAEVPITTVDFNAFHMFLQYIYMAPIQISVENISQLLMISDLFGVKKLVRECENFLLRKDVDEKDATELAIFHNLDRVLCEKIKEKSVDDLALWWSTDPKLPPAALSLMMKKLGVLTEQHKKLVKKDPEPPKQKEEPAVQPNAEVGSSSESDSESDTDSDSDSSA